MMMGWLPSIGPVLEPTAALAEAGEVWTVPLPSSAMMGMALIAGIGAFARFPSSKRRRKRQRGF